MKRAVLVVCFSTCAIMAMQKSALSPSRRDAVVQLDRTLCKKIVEDLALKRKEYSVGIPVRRSDELVYIKDYDCCFIYDKKGKRLELFGREYDTENGAKISTTKYYIDGITDDDITNFFNKLPSFLGAIDLDDCVPLVRNQQYQENLGYFVDQRGGTVTIYDDERKYTRSLDDIVNVTDHSLSAKNQSTITNLSAQTCTLIKRALEQYRIGQFEQNSKIEQKDEKKYKEKQEYSASSRSQQQIDHQELISKTNEQLNNHTSDVQSTDQYQTSVQLSSEQQKETATATQITDDSSYQALINMLIFVALALLAQNHVHKR